MRVGNEKLKTVRLLGELGKKFGETHRFAVNSAAEAVRALCANFPQFEGHLLESEKRNIGYHVSIDEMLIGENELGHPFSREIIFTPVIAGAGGSSDKILLGGVLALGGLILTAAGLPILGGVVLKVGAALMIGGVVQGLSRVPSFDGPQEIQDTPSYMFNGPVNTTAQGQPVPVGYGRMIVGGAVISAGTTLDDPNFQPRLVIR